MLKFGKEKLARLPIDILDQFDKIVWVTMRHSALTKEFAAFFCCPQKKRNFAEWHLFKVDKNAIIIHRFFFGFV